MQYINFDNKKIIKQIHKEAVSKVLDGLDSRTKKRYRTKKIIERIIGIFCGIIFAASFAFCIYIITKMQGADLGAYTGFYAITAAFGSFTFSVFAAVAVLVLLSVANERIFKDIDENKITSEFYKPVDKGVRREYLSRLYGLGTEYLVTKCFYSFRNEFCGKDVYVFFYEGKLRIVNFINLGERFVGKDIGYIEIDISKCTISFPGDEELLKYGKYATVIRENDQIVVLGSKAADFIKRGSQSGV